MLCGSPIWQSYPLAARSENGDILSPSLTLAGIKREFDHMTVKQVGKVVSMDRAKELADEWAIKIIGCRWVLSKKMRHAMVNGEQKPSEEVRSRCVVQDMRDGQSATTYGYSTPTSSVESLKILLAMAGEYDLSILSADVSTAYMSSPLPKSIKAIVRLPAGTCAAKGNSAFLVLENALNGLRPAALAWVLHFRRIVETTSQVQHSDLDPTLFVGYFHSHWIAILIYVDDLLILCDDLQTSRNFVKEIGKQIEVKEAGYLPDSKSGGGELIFLGRRIFRRANSSVVNVTMEKDFNEQLMKLGEGIKGCDTIPDLKHFLESMDEASLEFLSAESASQFRSAVGRLLWMLPFRPDLAAPLSMVSVGQSQPMVKHSRALKAIIRYIVGSINFCQRFLVNEASWYLQHAEDSSTLVCFCDASFAPMRTKQRKSLTGGLITFMGSVIRAFARSQVAVTLSSAEAELEAVAATVQEGMGLFHLCCFVLGIPQVELDGRAWYVNDNNERLKGLVLCTDSSAATAVLKREDIQRRLRHSEIKFEFLKDLIRLGVLQVKWQAGSENPSDMLTKVTSRALQLRYRPLVGLEDVGTLDAWEAISQCIEEARNDYNDRLHFEMQDVTSAEGRLPDSSDEPFVGSDVEDEESRAFISSLQVVQQLSQDDRRVMDNIFSNWQCNGSHKYLLVEFCCSPTSTLGAMWHNRGDAWVVWRVTVFGKRAETVWQLTEKIKGFLTVKGRAVWFHSSLPCTGGSTLQGYRAYDPQIRLKNSEIRALFKRLLSQVIVMAKQLVSLVDSSRLVFTFELSKTCSYWRWRRVHALKSCFPGLLYNCVVRLCACEEGRILEGCGVSKSWRLVCNHEGIVHQLSTKHGQSNCREHRKPHNYAMTAFYPSSLVRSWISAVIDVFHSKTFKLEGHTYVWTK